MIQIAPSILAADFANLAAQIKRVEEGGAGLIHIDVMDGHFVPNLTVGPPVVECIRSATRLPLDVHLMIAEPLRYVGAFLKAGADMISVHYEADPHIDRTIDYIRDGGARAGVAINPATPVAVLEEILYKLDFVLLMTVNPGFGGQKFIPSSYEKIRKLSALIAQNGYKARVQVDGGIGPDNLLKVIECGAEIIVSGSAIFGSPDPRQTVEEMYRLANENLKFQI